MPTSVLPSTSSSTPSSTTSQVLQQLANVQLSDLQGADLTNAKAVTINVQEEDSIITIELTFGYPNQSQYPAIKADIEAALADLMASLNKSLQISFSHKIKRHQIQSNTKGLPTIKNTIAVGSGKGGVGKSSVAVNLAFALQQEGAKVGLLDADIYGPSIPTMFASSERPTSPDGKTMNPIKIAGIETISIGYLIESDTPMIWRGPMVTNTLKQLLSETNWGDLDYLIIDLPPGTGDIQLTLAQSIPVSGSLIVTTPQNVALMDAKKAIRMFEKVNIHLLGVIENMSLFECPHCHSVSHIFRQGGGKQLADSYDVTLLGNLPLDSDICSTLDEGQLLSKKHPKLFDQYATIARKAAASLALRPVDFASKMPKVEIRNLTNG